MCCTLQQAIAYCTTVLYRILQHSIVTFNVFESTLQQSSASSGNLRYSTQILQESTLVYRILQDFAIWYNASSTLQWPTILYSRLHYSILQYSQAFCRVFRSFPVCSIVFYTML